MPEQRRIGAVESGEQAAAQGKCRGKLARRRSHARGVVHKFPAYLWLTRAKIDRSFEAATVEIRVFFWKAEAPVIPIVPQLVEEPVVLRVHLHQPVQAPARFVEHVR